MVGQQMYTLFNRMEEFTVINLLGFHLSSGAWCRVILGYLRDVNVSFVLKFRACQFGFLALTSPRQL